MLFMLFTDDHDPRRTHPPTHPMATAAAILAGHLSTPIRALPSILASKVAPAVPPASKTYVPLVQTVLRHRLIRWVFLNSILFSWLLICARIYLSGNGTLTSLVSNAWLLVSPSTGLFVALTFTLSVVPVVVARKSLLKGAWCPRK